MLFILSTLAWRTTVKNGFPLVLCYPCRCHTASTCTFVILSQHFILSKLILENNMYYWCVFPLNDFTAKYTSCLFCKISFATSRGMGEVYPTTFWKLKKVPWFWEKRFWLPLSVTNISRLKCCFSRENVEKR